jgi:hypothetical protein
MTFAPHGDEVLLLVASCPREEAAANRAVFEGILASLEVTAPAAEPAQPRSPSGPVLHPSDATG